jgi:hypothetical protein
MKYIHTSDWHVRLKAPVCRTDDWLPFQESRIRMVFDLAVKHKAEIIHTGDIFDNSDISKEMLHLILAILSEYKIQFTAIPGNHSLFGNNPEMLYKCKVGLIGYHPNVNLITPDINFTADYKGMKLIHQLTFPTKESIPSMITAHCAADWLEQYPDNPFILCGDYHGNHCTIGANGNLCVNPGCLSSQKVSEAYEHGVYLLDTDKHTAKFIPLPDDTMFVSEEHLTAKKEKLENTDALVEQLRSMHEGKISLDFFANLEYKLAILYNREELSSFIHSCREVN